jgi:hypothetical protein
MMSEMGISNFGKIVTFKPLIMKAIKGSPILGEYFSRENDLFPDL